MGSRNTFNLFTCPLQKNNNITTPSFPVPLISSIKMHAAPSATQLSQWSLRMRRHAKARTARHCAVWELVRPTRLTGADIWPGLYIVYVYSLQFHSHCSNLKQFEAAVALPSTGHVQVSVPWDTCSQPQGVSTPLCRVGSNDKPAGDSVWQQPGVEKRALRPWFLWCSFSNEGRCSGNQNFSPGWVTTFYSKAGKGHNHQVS